jgi:phosphate transport system protein
MQEHFEQEIQNLKTNLISMASLVDEQVEKVVGALDTCNLELCKGVKGKDLEVDAYDNLIQTQCENIFALFQPVATDLRFLMSVLMINNQLERCGDIAVNIGNRVKKIVEQRELIAESKITEMAKNARVMLQQAIDASIHNDTELARLVINMDDTVDKLNKQIFKYLISKMSVQPELIETASHMIVLTRHIERLADHATNIAEDVIFYLEGKIIAHQKRLEKRE